jgi:hypothetical protein
MSRHQVRLEWIVEVTDEEALFQYVRNKVENDLLPHPSAGEVAAGISGDVTRSLIQIASERLLRAEVPGVGAQQLVSEPAG